MVIIFLIFWGISILSSTVAVPIYIPSTMFECCISSTSSPTLVNSCLFDNSHSDRFEVVLIFISLISSDENFFMCLWPSVCPHWKKRLFSSSTYFLVRLLCYCCVIWVLNIFWMLTLYQTYHLQIFSPISKLYFCFIAGFLCCADVF